MAGFLQQLSTAGDFATYSFIQVLIATSLSVSSGLFASPLIHTMAVTGTGKKAVLHSFFYANLVFCVILSASSALLSYLFLSSNPDFWVISAACTFLNLFRWFMRSLYLAENKSSQAKTSDIIYSFFSITLLFISVLVGNVSSFNILAIQSFSCALSVVVLFKPYLHLTRQASKGSLSIFLSSLRTKGSWALADAFSTSIIGNMHAYVVTLIVSPAAFAPIALATMMFRPLGVALTGLVLFERPRMAKSIATRSAEKLRADIRFVTVSVIGVWVCNLLLVAIALVLFPTKIFRPGFPPEEVILATGVLAVAVLLRAIREPRGAVLQAAGKFRSLATSSAASAAATILAVIMLAPYIVDRPSYILIAPLIGETICLFATTKKCRREVFGAFWDRSSATSTT